MLQTLKSYSNREAAVILAGLSRQLLPEELLEPTHDSIFVDANVQRSVLQEALRKLGLTEEDKSEESQVRLINFIGKEMSRAALADADLQEIKKRVGQQGNLRTDAYKVILTSAREKEFRQFDVSRSEVKNAVSQADDFQHLLPGIFGPTDSAVSLFVKKYVNEDDPFTILVQTERSGATLIINHAFKIYHVDVDLDDALTPLDILLAFIDKYGVNISVGDESGKFVLYKSIPRTDSPEGTTFFTIAGGLASGTKTRSGFHVKVTETTIEVAIGYMINETQYLADLAKHKYSHRK